MKTKKITSRNNYSIKACNDLFKIKEKREKEGVLSR